MATSEDVRSHLPPAAPIFPPASVRNIHLNPAFANTIPETGSFFIGILARIGKTGKCGPIYGVAPVVRTEEEQVSSCCLATVAVART